MTDQVPRNGNGVLMALPMWARATAVLGVPSVIALYLVYAMNTRATDITRQIAEELAAIQTSVKENQSLLLRHVEDSNRIVSTIERYMLRICINTAATAEDRQECLK